jgi:hypothetical protein
MPALNVGGRHTLWKSAELCILRRPQQQMPMLREVPNYVKRSFFIHELSSVSPPFTAHNPVCSPGRFTDRQTAFCWTAGALGPSELVFQAVSRPELCAVNIAKSREHRQE